MRIIRGIVVSLLFLAVCQVAAAETTPVGKVTSIEGIVDIARADQEAMTLKEKDCVSLGDRIRTKSYSKAQVLFNDKSILRIAPNSCVTIDEYSITADNRREHAVIKLTRGKVEAVVSKTGKPETFVINTPNAAGSVKGSDIFVFYQAGKTGVLVKDGLMSVSNIALPEQKLDVSPGDTSVVSFDKIPAEARPYLDAEIASHIKDVAPALAKKWIPGRGALEMKGTVTSMGGTVRVWNKGASDWKAGQKNDSLSEGDKVQTAEDGRAEIRLDNGNVIFLQANTELAFTMMRYDPSTGEFDNTFESNNGKIKAVIEKLGKKSTFQIKTPTAVCGARGTVMYLDVQPASTQAFYEGGNGAVTSTVSGQTQEVGAGQNSTADAGGAISAPTYTSNEQRTSLDQSWTGTPAADAYSQGPGPAAMTGGPGGSGGLAGGQLPLGDSTMTQGPPPPINNLPFDQATNLINQPPAATNIYSSVLTRAVGTDAGISSVSTNLTLMSNGTWSAPLSGFYGSTVTAPFAVILSNAQGDYMGFSDIDGNLGVSSTGHWEDYTVSFSGDVHGAPPDKTLNLTKVVGDYFGMGSGSFSGEATGTWH